jgi:uncharacterized protein (DUF488 family)
VADLEVKTASSGRRGTATLLLTVGHSTHPFEEFVDILRAHGVERVVDVRTIPRSRHNPQFERDALSSRLRNRRIGYRHISALGGLRRPLPDSPNDGWRNSSFRGFADHMQTREFSHAIDTLIELSGQKRTVIMCAEAVPWRCHRSLIADALIVRGVFVEHIYSATSRKPHLLNPMARVCGSLITYPAAKPDARSSSPS